MSICIVFVHGYSVTNLNTYGELPVRLKKEAQTQNINVEIKEIFLGRYISFHDEVKLADIAKALNAAFQEQLANKSQVVCITHSTGGPVVREWWNRYVSHSGSLISHLIMMAPANFGSALAQLGKSKLSRIVTFFQGVEPGQKVLDWLELGSIDAWELNKRWTQQEGMSVGEQKLFPFVITGQSIDRKLYDNLNSYTGELGSDGVVRAAAANLNSTYLKLIQSIPQKNTKGIYEAKDLILDDLVYSAPKTPFKIVSGKSHSGDDMGIIKSIKADVNDQKSDETVEAILQCIQVKSVIDYRSLADQFDAENVQVQKHELLETDRDLFVFQRNFIHDRFSMVIIQVTDTEGNPVTDFDLLFTAGDWNSPDHLPEGFFADRQKNQKNQNTITYFLNYDVMHGCPEVKNADGKVIREPLPGTNKLGLMIKPRPTEGFVRYLPAGISASKELFEKVLKPNSTTMIEIVLQRLVSKEVFRFEELTQEVMPNKKQGDFADKKPGQELSF